MSLKNFNRKKSTAFKTGVVLGTLMMLLTSMTATVSADEPYDVYNYDRYGEAVPSQAGYIAERCVSGEDLGIDLFVEPNDIFKDHNDIFYIADAGNNRIVAVDSDFREVIRIYDTFTMPDGSETTITEPTGVYVSPYTDLLYICDMRDKKIGRVLVCDLEGNVQLELNMPNDASYVTSDDTSSDTDSADTTEESDDSDESADEEAETEEQEAQDDSSTDDTVTSSKNTFLPQKVLADKAGNAYVVVKGVTNGALVYDSEGNFTSYYGANRVETTAEVLSNYFWTSIATDEMRARRTRTTSSPIANFDIDAEGFIYTCMESSTQDLDKIKKLNAAGNNLFANYEITIGDNDLWVAQTNQSYKTHIVDIEIADDNTINCLDMTTGRVFQYDEDCNLLFIVGTNANQVGGFRYAVAMESFEDKLYVLDRTKGTVTIFKETEFGALVHEANSLYNDGYYDEALEPWYEVLKYDGNYRRAYIGVASALQNKGEYKEAMKYSKLAMASKRYNKAFEGYRSELLNKYFNVIMIGVVVLVVVFIVLKIRKSRKNKQKGGAAS